MIMRDGVTVTKVCAFIVSSDTVYLEYPNANLYGFGGFGTTACYPPPVVCAQVPACEVLSQSLWCSPFSRSQADCIMKTNHVMINPP